MSKRNMLLLEGNLASPPPVSLFLDALKRFADNQKAPRESDPVHGSAFAHGNKKPSGSEYSQTAAINCAMQFKELCITLGTPDYESADAWLLGLARWAMKVDVMFDDADEGRRFQAERADKCQGRFKLYNMSAQSFRTYINALGRAYNATQQQPYVVMSSLKQFPQMNAFMRCALTREAAKKSLNANSVDYDDNVLKEEELPALCAATDFTKPLQAQRYNILILAYRTGFRPEMLLRLKVGSFQTEVEHNGRKVMTVILGSMKQLVQDMTRCDIALFKCPIMQGDNPMFCPVAAIERQLQLLRNVWHAESCAVQ